MLPPQLDNSQMEGERIGIYALSKNNTATHHILISRLLQETKKLVPIKILSLSEFTAFIYPADMYWACCFQGTPASAPLGKDFWAPIPFSWSCNCFSLQCCGHQLFLTPWLGSGPPKYRDSACSRSRGLLSNTLDSMLSGNYTNRIGRERHAQLPPHAQIPTKMEMSMY